MRKISATMATQHPDNAQAPFWSPESAYIDARKEFNEALVNWQELGIDESMWDWEGKHADAAIIDRLFSEQHRYFTDTQLGRDKFLTFRFPNIWQEKGYSLMQAMTTMLAAEDFARDIGFDNRPLFEAILPMTERPEQLLRMQELFEKLAYFKTSEFAPERIKNNEYLEIIPLIESVESQHNVKEFVREFFELHQAHFGRLPEYFRLFLACSDPAIAAGHLATVLANKIGLSDLYQIAHEAGVAVFPITGPGSLPFRGGLSPDSAEQYASEFPGVRTSTIQSAFRYDYPKGAVIAAVQKLEDILPKAQPLDFSPEVRKQLLQISDIAQQQYQETFSGILPDLDPYFTAFPKRRERRSHIDLLGYGRTIGQRTVPRAITFTGSIYSIGVPPELIGLGRTLHDLSDEQRQLLIDTYPHLREDIMRAGSFLSEQNLHALVTKNTAWAAVEQDVDFIEQILDIKLEPHTPEQSQHIELSTKARDHLADKPALTSHIEQMAVARKSLG